MGLVPKHNHATVGPIHNFFMSVGKLNKQSTELSRQPTHGSSACKHGLRFSYDGAGCRPSRDATNLLPVCLVMCGCARPMTKAPDATNIVQLLAGPWWATKCRS
jgi:hypothetical protein